MTTISGDLVSPVVSKNSTLIGGDVRQQLATRAYDNPLQLRRLFVTRSSPEDPSPTLARLIRGGRGSDVRLKLLLSMLLVARGGRHDTNLPARSWAEALGLADAEGNGARQVRNAMEWLAERNLLVLQHQPGVPTEVIVLEETGSGKPYQIPGMAGAKAKTDRRPVPSRHLYIKVPSDLWTNGWIVSLTTPALAVLLMLLVEKRGRDDETILALAQSRVKDRYDLSADTLYRGVHELLDQGVLELLGRQSGRRDEFRRRHNIYRLHLDRLQTPPPEVAPSADNKLVG